MPSRNNSEIIFLNISAKPINALMSPDRCARRAKSPPPVFSHSGKLIPRIQPLSDDSELRNQIAIFVLSQIGTLRLFQIPKSRPLPARRAFRRRVYFLTFSACQISCSTRKISSSVSSLRAAARTKQHSFRPRKIRPRKQPQNQIRHRHTSAIIHPRAQPYARADEKTGFRIARFEFFLQQQLPKNHIRLFASQPGRAVIRRTIEPIVNRTGVVRPGFRNEHQRDAWDCRAVGLPTDRRLNDIPFDLN